MKRWFGAIAALLVVALGMPLALVRAAPPAVVYFPQTGHHVGAPFLTYWRTRGGLPVYGYPLTEAFTEVSPDDGKPYTVQYFERARLELHPENQPPWDIMLGHLGRAAAQRLGPNPALPPIPPGQAQDTATRRYFPETGHTLQAGFLLHWQAYGGLDQFGYPLTEEFAEVSLADNKPYTVQYFERARFEWHPENQAPWNVLLGQLGRQIAAERKIDTKAVPRQADVPDYDEGLFATPTPTPRPAPAGPGVAGKVIEVNLSQQHLYAWQNGALVFDVAISSGRAGYETPTGRYSVIRMAVSEDMRGADYYQPDVPSILYFTGAGHAVHGVYWHNNFGTPMSHGCVGAPVWAAQWLFNWGYVGLPIWIHY